MLSSAKRADELKCRVELQCERKNKSKKKCACRHLTLIAFATTNELLFHL